MTTSDPTGPAVCPYCQAALAKMPQRKTKCPHCTRPIYIKYTPDDRTKRLMTELEAGAAEEKWRAHGQMERLYLQAQAATISRTELDAAIVRTRSLPEVALMNLCMPKAMKGDRGAIGLMEFLADPESSMRWRLMRLEIDLGRLRLSGVRRPIVFATQYPQDLSHCETCAPLHGRVIEAGEQLVDMVPPVCPMVARKRSCGIGINFDFSDPQADL